MDIDVAERLSRLMLRLSANLDQSVAYVQDNCSDSEFKEYRRAVGQILGEICVEIEEKIWKEHPSLRPLQSNGPYVADESVYEPHFYRRNREDGAV